MGSRGEKKLKALKPVLCISRAFTSKTAPVTVYTCDPFILSLLCFPTRVKRGFTFKSWFTPWIAKEHTASACTYNPDAVRYQPIHLNGLKLGGTAPKVVHALLLLTRNQVSAVQIWERMPDAKKVNVLLQEKVEPYDRQGKIKNKSPIGTPSQHKTLNS